MDVNKEFMQRETELSAVLNDCENKLKKSPSGWLKVRSYKGKNYYYLRQNSSDMVGKYIKQKEREVARRLAQRDYELDVKASIEKEIAAMRSYRHKMPERTYEQTYDNLISGRKVLITPHFVPDDEYVKTWLEEPYEIYPVDDGEARHFTDNGDAVRSKSEVLIANALHNAGIPYKYECPLFLGSKKKYPDFTILKMPSRKVIYWEHLGMLDDAEYVNQNMKKLDLYEENGIFIGDGLIVTRETSELPLNTKKVWATIEHYLL